MARKKYSLMVARFPGGNIEHPASSGWIMEMQRRWINETPEISDIVPLKISDTPITMCRNRAVRTALDMGVDYILMIDNDMEPDHLVGTDSTAKPFWESSWEFMMRRREREDGGEELPPATIAAPYCGPPPDESVYVMQWKGVGVGTPDVRFRLEMVDRELASVSTGIQEVAALATGLILYDARVFQKLPAPWFDYEYEDPPFNTKKATTEDIFQTRNAHLLGMPQFVNWDAWAAHWKLKKVGKPRAIPNDFVRGAVGDAMRNGRFASNERVRHNAR